MSIKKIKASKPGHWNEVETKVYKTEGTSFKDIVRRTLISKESPDCPSELRYFEVGKAGYSSLELHEHTHTVIVLKGHGVAIIGEEKFEANPGDIFYVAPWQPHQFLQEGSEPFGFYCMVPQQRDKPNLLPPEEQRKYQEKFGAKI